MKSLCFAVNTCLGCGAKPQGPGRARPAGGVGVHCSSRCCARASVREPDPPGGPRGPTQSLQEGCSTRSSLCGFMLSAQVYFYACSPQTRGLTRTLRVQFRGEQVGGHVSLLSSLLTGSKSREVPRPQPAPRVLAPAAQLRLQAPTTPALSLEAPWEPECPAAPCKARGLQIARHCA